MDLEYRQFRNIDIVFLGFFVYIIGLIESIFLLMFSGVLLATLFTILYIFQDYIPHVIETVKEYKKPKGS